MKEDGKGEVRENKEGKMEVRLETAGQTLRERKGKWRKVEDSEIIIVSCQGV